MAYLGTLNPYLSVIIAYLGALIAEWVVKWNMDSYVLLRIQILMGFLVFQYYMILTAMMFFPTRPPRMKLLESGSDTILVYIMGTMQVAPFENEMFPLWALLLVSFRSSVNFLSRYNTEIEVVNIMKLLAVILLSKRHGTKSWGIPFWSFWVIMVLKSLYRFLAHRRASDHLWYGPSSEILHEYMGTDQGRSELLVYGEPNESNMCDESPSTSTDELRSDEEAAQSLMTGQSRSMDETGSLITFDKIRRDGGGLLQRIINRRMNNPMDVTLAFAMSRLLRCRLEGATLHADTISMTREQIRSTILVRQNLERVLCGVLKVEVAFLSEHLYTGYPLIFWQGLRSLSFHAMLFLLRCISYLFLFREICGSNTTGQPRVNADDVGISLGAMIVMLMMDYVEIYRYVGSYWTSLLIVCKYVKSSKTSVRIFLEILMFHCATMLSCIFEQVIMVFYTSHYDLLQSSKYSSRELETVAIKVGLAEVLLPGRPFDDVITAVIQSAINPTRHNVMNTGIRHLLPPAASDHTYWSACLQLQSCSHVILVWHIATSLCEIKLAQDHGTTTRELYYRKRGSHLNKQLKKTHLVAQCLSRYCLYLLISKPNLLPGNTFVCKKILRDTIELAGQKLKSRDSPSQQSQSIGWFKKMLGGFGRKLFQGRHWLKSKLQTWSSFHQEFQQELQERSDKLIGDAVIPIKDIKLSENILQQGAIVAKELMMKEREERRWEIIADVWADLIVQIAPSSKLDAHRKELEHGTELLTLIWALLCHCGIEKSELWPDDAEAGETLQEHLDKKNAAHDGDEQMDVVPAPSPAAPPNDAQGGKTTPTTF